MQFETPYWPSKITTYSKARLSGMNMSDSARYAGYSESVARQASNQLEPRHNMRIKEALEAAGGTNDVLSAVIMDAVKAERAIIVDKSVQYVVDHKTRLEATKLCLEAKGELKSNTAVQVTINMPSGLGELLLQDSHEYVEAPIVITDGADSTE